MLQRFVLGDYKTLTEIGWSRFGVIFLASGKESGRYAIKELRFEKLTKEDKIDLFTSGNISKKLDHFTLSKEHQKLKTQEAYYLVAPAWGPDLKLELMKRLKISFREVMLFIEQMRNGLKHLHQNQVMFRGLRLSKILLRREKSWRIVMIGFGRTKDASLETRNPERWQYLAPEILNQSSEFTFKADIWAFALCCWELLYGFRSFPFSTASLIALKSDINLHSGPDLKFPENPKYPAEVRDFFQRCLQKDLQLRIGPDEFFAHPFFALSTRTLCKYGFTDEELFDADPKHCKNHGWVSQDHRCFPRYCCFDDYRGHFRDWAVKIEIYLRIIKKLVQISKIFADAEFEFNLLALASIFGFKANRDMRKLSREVSRVSKGFKEASESHKKNELCLVYDIYEEVKRQEEEVPKVFADTVSKFEACDDFEFTKDVFRHVFLKDEGTDKEQEDLHVAILSKISGKAPAFFQETELNDFQKLLETVTKRLSDNPYFFVDD